MPDVKCTACRIRLRSHPGEAMARLCPECEAPLEPVGELSEIVGFRLREADRWLDDGASFDSEEMAAALEPPPDWTYR
jgi:hypothetical protein